MCIIYNHLFFSRVFSLSKHSSTFRSRLVCPQKTDSSAIGPASWRSDQSESGTSDIAIWPRLPPVHANIVVRLWVSIVEYRQSNARVRLRVSSVHLSCCFTTELMLHFCSARVSGLKSRPQANISTAPHIHDPRVWTAQCCGN